MLDSLFEQSREHSIARIWIFSDLQQALPEMAEDCLARALEDILPLSKGFTHLWCLGDAMEGSQIDRVTRMVQMQVDRLKPLGLPLRFIMGNHDLDCTSRLPPGSTPVLPVWEAFRQVPDWKTTATPDAFWFSETIGPVRVVFLSDHVATDNAWLATQQEVRGEFPDRYPWTLADYQQLRNHIAEWPGPVILAGHYAFPGGPREPPPHGLLHRLLPLPDNVRLHFHGHAHTGDWPYGADKTFQRISTISWHQVQQLNISSLDRTRGSQTRSAILDISRDGNFTVFFRDHEDKTWSDIYICNSQAPRSRTEASTRHHSRRTDLSQTELGKWRAQHPEL